MKKILIANRGEIAIRIARSVVEKGFAPVMLFSDADASAPHPRMGKEAYRLAGKTPAETYLDIEKILTIAKKASVWGVHPGYGFLSENAEFSAGCEKTGLVFIGPSAENIKSMGDKIVARTLAKKAGVPTLSGSDFASTAEEAKAQAKHIGYPVLLKAKAGGGGKGMRRVDREADIDEAFRLARSEAEKSFKDGTLYVEKYLERARHVEVQVFGDSHGQAFAIADRDCSIQRRHQKIIEEAPAPLLSEKTRGAMAEAAMNLTRSVGYRGAGTLEFLVNHDESFHFLEMNTRLQVEHPVTEWISGLDLVALQIDVALGLKISVPSRSHGHALEVRVYAEDPDNQFFPMPGKLLHVSWPTGPFVRVDTGVETGSEVTLYYDPMLAKISVWGHTREEAVERMLRALKETTIVGTKTNLGFLFNILSHPAFKKSDLSTQFIPQHGPFPSRPLSEAETFAALAGVYDTQAAPQTADRPAARDESMSAWWASGLARPR